MQTQAAMRSMKSVNIRVMKWKHKPHKFAMLPLLKKPLVGHVTQATIRQAFLDVSMVNRLDGLSTIAARHNLDVASLKKGDFLLFVNASFTCIALLGYGGVVLYQHAPKGSRISMLFIEELPKLFHGQALNYDEVMGPVLARFIEKKRERRVEPKEKA